MKFTYLRPWENQISAEAEFGPRLKNAAGRVGLECNVATIDQINGTPVHQRSEVFGSFVLLPHFTQPPIEGLKSIAILWNSPSTVSKYSHGTVNIALANYFLSGGSVETDSYFLDQSGGKLLGDLYPSAIELNLKSNANRMSKAFYSGINWERITGEKTRHATLLNLLDVCDLIDIYGPNKLQGVKVWEGFKNYKGELEGDGEQVVRIANNYGVSLGLLNSDHIAWGLVPMRISEAFAAKNVLISEQHPILEGFQDTSFIIPDEFDLEQKAKYIGEKLSFIRRNPEISREMAQESSKRWFSKHSVEEQILEFTKQFMRFESVSLHDSIDDLPGVKHTNTFLDPHEPTTYFKKLMNLSESSKGSLVFHKDVSDETRVQVEKYFNEKPETCYILGFVDLGTDGNFQPHSSLENIEDQPGCWFSSEALVLNLDALDLANTNAFSWGLARFFEKLLLGELGAGEVLPINFGRLDKTWRYNLPLKIANNVSLLNPGKVSDIYWTGAVQSVNSIKAIRVVYNSLPPLIRNILRRIRNRNL